ncbi:MAG: hypothetical protein HOC88_16090 [Rhodospirillaceae bacterium]|nr:hypothetical protein [Rhodospirillaceae bacterium]
MATPKQISANRKNASKNTGPNSATAKKAVRLNALRHGLAAESQVLPSENRADFDHIEAQFYAQYPPESGLEGFFLEQMVACAWRLRRVTQVESDVFQHFQHQIDNPAPRIIGIAGVSGFDDASFEHGADGDAGGADNDAGGADNWQDAGAPAFITAPSAPPARAASPGQAFLKANTEADLFVKINRHEATIRAGFYRAYDELQRLRAARSADTRRRGPRRRRGARR